MIDAFIFGVSMRRDAGRAFDPTIVPLPIGELAKWTIEESDKGWVEAPEVASLRCLQASGYRVVAGGYRGVPYDDPGGGLMATIDTAPATAEQRRQLVARSDVAPGRWSRALDRAPSAA